MKTIQFRCKLLSDVILSQKAATEGSHESLSFIPGNNFLGIVAQNYTQYASNEQAEIFHSGHVRFSDAHPVNRDGKIRSLHIPAALYYPKLTVTRIKRKTENPCSSNNAAKGSMFSNLMKPRKWRSARVLPSRAHMTGNCAEAPTHRCTATRAWKRAMSSCLA